MYLLQGTVNSKDNGQLYANRTKDTMPYGTEPFFY